MASAPSSILRLYDFSGGYRGDLGESKLKPNDMRKVDGFQLSVDGPLHKVTGFTDYNAVDLGGPILGMHRYKGTGSPTLLVAVGSNLYTGDDATGTFTSIYGTLTPGNQTFFHTWKNLAFIVNGVDAPLQWDGTTVSAVANAPIGRLVSQYADRLFMVEGTDTLKFSELLDPTTWTDTETGITNLINVTVGDDEQITGLMATQSRLAIYKTRSTHYLLGFDESEWNNLTISSDLGCVAPRSLVSLDGRSIFLSHRGVYMDDGQNFIPIGSPVQDILDKCTLPQLATAVGSQFGWRYRLDVPDHPDGPQRLEYELRTQKWTTRSIPIRVGATSYFNLDGDSGKAVVGLADTGKVLYEDGGLVNGAGFTASMRTKRLGLTSPELVLDLRRIAVDCQLAAGDTATLRWYFNGSDVEAGSSPVNDGRTFISVPLNQNLGNDVAFQIEITGTGVGSIFTGLDCEIRDKRRQWR